MTFSNHVTVKKLVVPSSSYHQHFCSLRINRYCKMNLFCAKVHGLSEASPYWICTFANNQHNLEDENTDEKSQEAFQNTGQELNTSDLLDTPFVRAIMSSSCMGTAAGMQQNDLAK